MTFPRRSAFAICAVSAALTITGCGLEAPADEKEGAEAPTAPFLRTSEFASSNLRDIEGFALSNQLDGDTDLLADPPDEANDSSDGSCPAALDETRVSATADRMTLGLSIDLTDCTRAAMQKEQGTDPGDKISEVSGKMFVDFRCVGGDLSVYDGKTLKELGAAKVNPCVDVGGTQWTSLYQSEFIYKATFMIQKTAGGAKETIIVDSRSIEHSGISDTEGCAGAAADGTFTLKGTCTHLSLDLERGTDGKDELRSLIESGLSYKDNDVFYRTGKITVDLNGWKGDIVYTGATEGPKWTLTKGDKTESATLSEIDPKDKQSAEKPEDAETQNSSAEADTKPTSEESGADATSTAVGIDTETSTQEAAAGADATGLNLTSGARKAPALELPASLRKLLGKH